MRRMTTAGRFWLGYIVILIAVTVWLCSCVTQSRSCEEVVRTEWCGEMPPILGDDC